MVKMKKNINNVVLYIVTMLVVLVGDQLSKIVVAINMTMGASVEIIDNFFYFTYAQNKGAAWSMFEGHVEFFIIFALVALVGLVYYFIKTDSKEHLTRFGIILIISGLLGNVFDRIVLGYVRDFIDFIVFGYDFPIFNIADIAIVIGVGLMMIEVFMEEE